MIVPGLWRAFVDEPSRPRQHAVRSLCRRRDLEPAAGQHSKMIDDASRRGKVPGLLASGQPIRLLGCPMR